MIDTAHEIQENHLNQEEGIALGNYYDRGFPQKYFKNRPEYHDITKE